MNDIIINNIKYDLCISSNSKEKYSLLSSINNNDVIYFSKGENNKLLEEFLFQYIFNLHKNELNMNTIIILCVIENNLENFRFYKIKDGIIEFYQTLDDISYQYFKNKHYNKLKKQKLLEIKIIDTKFKYTIHRIKSNIKNNIEYTNESFLNFTYSSVLKKKEIFKFFSFIIIFMIFPFFMNYIYNLNDVKITSIDNSNYKSLIDNYYTLHDKQEQYKMLEQKSLVLQNIKNDLKISIIDNNIENLVQEKLSYLKEL